MLKNKDLHDEIENIREVSKNLKDPFQQKLLLGITLELKLLHNLRTNMVEVMKHLNISLVKSKRRISVEEQDTTETQK